jgi:phage tail-like protein
MDANGLRFWMLADARHWRISESSNVEYDHEGQTLRLASERTSSPASDGVADESRAKSLVEVPPQTIDAFGMRAFWDDELTAVVATGARPGNVPILLPAANTWPSDLAIGHDGVLYLAMAIEGSVSMLDLRDNWGLVTLQDPDFKAWRLAADPHGGVWVLDRVNNMIGRVTGVPSPARPYGPYSPNTFRPCPENSNPPRLQVIKSATIPDNESAVAIACGPTGQTAVLSWQKRGETTHEPGFALVRLLTGEEFGPPIEIRDVSFPYSLAWVSEDRIAVLAENVKREALVFRLAPGSNQLPVGDMYPLTAREAIIDQQEKQANGPFLNGLTLPPHYPTVEGSLPLHRLSLPSYATGGEASNQVLLDSGSGQTVWHRLYLEAAIPPNCGVKIFLAANDEPVAPTEDQEWFEHRFGEMFQHSIGDNIPRGAWVSEPSEIPFSQSLLKCAPVKNRRGLFTVLIQRSDRVVRTMRGRYIHVRVALYGDGRTTPEVAAIRVYGSRFSYLNRYLPEMFRETLFGDDADDKFSPTKPPSRYDFLERFLDNFEGILTPLEDRIASSYLLTDPRTTREDALEWLGSWIGITFDPAYPTDRRREIIEAAPDLYRRRGTYDGLRLALNIVTAGAIERREIVVLEDFRLRRTFATILGADLANEDDPLLGGLAVSGNSYVGDALFLGDEHRKEFLALFSADLRTNESEQEAIESLYTTLAHRVTILIHREMDPYLVGLVRRVVDLETPAHVLSRIVRARFRFLIGLASLVGVDTFIGGTEERQPVRVDESNIGERDFISRPPSLDPRLEGSAEKLTARLQKPVAVLKAPGEVNDGESFNLAGDESTAPEDRTITRYIWQRNN